MTRFKVVIALACFAVAFAGCAKPRPAESPAAAPAAQVSTPEVEITVNSLNVRATPSPTGAVVGSLKRGERASAPEAAADGWLYVESSAGLKGYVSSKYVQFLDASAASAPAEAAPATAAPAAKSAPAPAQAAARKPAPGTKLALITEGMSEAQVIEILGAPTSQQNYMTGKAWIPFYYGPDTGRLDYRYKGLGLVSFSRSRYSGGTKVIRVDADPNEDGIK